MELSSQPQIYFERVDSTTAGAAYNYVSSGSKDISRTLCDLEQFPVIKIKVSKGFSFNNLDTEYHFEQQRSHFFQVSIYHLAPRLIS